MSKVCHLSCPSEFVSYFELFGHFLIPRWSDLTNSLSNELVILRHKFRVTTTYYSETDENPLKLLTLGTLSFSIFMASFQECIFANIIYS